MDAAPTERKRILVVEEEKHLRALLDRFLAERGYELLDAASPEEALERCKASTQPVHLMICDLVFRAITGTELTRQAREFHPDLKTLYLTAHSESSVIYRGIPLEAVTLFPKPFSLKALLEKIDALLAP